MIGVIQGTAARSGTELGPHPNQFREKLNIQSLLEEAHS